MTDNKTLTLDVWSEIACPWCWVGKRNLEAAIAQFDGSVSVRWRAFQLNPEAPPTSSEPVDYVQRLATKYNQSRAGAQGFIDRMVQAGAERGLEFRFDQIRPGNTFDAHRLMAWSRASGHADALKERLFKAYMNEGRTIDDREVLSALASDVGLDATEALELLASEQFAPEVLADRAAAGELGIRGVPFFWVESQMGASGAQPTEALLDLFAKASQS